MKTVLVLTYGFLRLSSTPSPRNMLGIGVAMMGMVSYGFVKERERKQQDVKLALPKTSPSRETRILSDGPITPIKSQ